MAICGSMGMYYLYSDCSHNDRISRSSGSSPFTDEFDEPCTAAILIEIIRKVQKIQQNVSYYFPRYMLNLL